ncbi:uncharacterized mitochondrial protein AtMg00820-like [Vicia villosa]|uniref:uncharacterized mitochondrial protein AtMg00820-like n=1 Tax=Vicia villosa TaxID=3911 RepID=UPI00273AE2A6|nr:uncharacterized mitochondrial protein AtMg00820-like [Vicia villosa]
MGESEPVKIEEALSDPKSICAMKEEMELIDKEKDLGASYFPQGKKPIGVKWVYKVKANPKGEVVKHNAILVAKGFLQKKGIYFEEVFAPQERIETIILVLGLQTTTIDPFIKWT